MREFGKREIFNFKCPICGSLNKKFIPIMYKHIPYGYTLHCCNCGNLTEFIKPSKSIGGVYNGQFSAGEEKEQRCYALNECTITDCPLYDTYLADKDSGYDDEQNPGDIDEPYPGYPDDCPICPGNKCEGTHFGVYGDDFSNLKELVVKVEKEDHDIR